MGLASAARPKRPSARCMGGPMSSRAAPVFSAALAINGLARFSGQPLSSFSGPGMGGWYCSISTFAPLSAAVLAIASSPACVAAFCSSLAGRSLPPKRMTTMSGSRSAMSALARLTPPGQFSLGLGAVLSPAQPVLRTSTLPSPRFASAIMPTRSANLMYWWRYGASGRLPVMLSPKKTIRSTPGFFGGGSWRLGFGFGWATATAATATTVVNIIRATAGMGDPFAMAKPPAGASSPVDDTAGGPATQGEPPRR